MIEFVLAMGNIALGVVVVTSMIVVAAAIAYRVAASLS